MENIPGILKQLEQKKAIKILYACETGSRAWGFPSPDSDYDIRFIYMHERDWYLCLAHRKDTIEHLEGELDITGWDLRKSLVLLKKSNASLIERFQSPVEYYADSSFKTAFKELIKNYYSPTAVFYHHYSLAKKFWEEIKDSDEYKLKSFFYLVRSLLSCNWISKEQEVVPMHLEGLLKHVDKNYQTAFRNLVQLKAGVGENYLHKKDHELNKWIEEMFIELEKLKNNLGVNRTDYSLLNRFFIKMLNTDVDS